MWNVEKDGKVIGAFADRRDAFHFWRQTVDRELNVFPFSNYFAGEIILKRPDNTNWRVYLNGGLKPEDFQ